MRVNTINTINTTTYTQKNYGKIIQVRHQNVNFNGVKCAGAMFLDPIIPVSPFALAIMLEIMDIVTGDCAEEPLKSDNKESDIM